MIGLGWQADWGSADVGRSNGLVAGTLERRDEGWRIGRKKGKRRVGEREKGGEEDGEREKRKVSVGE